MSERVSDWVGGCAHSRQQDPEKIPRATRAIIEVSYEAEALVVACPCARARGRRARGWVCMFVRRRCDERLMCWQGGEDHQGVPR